MIADIIAFARRLWEAGYVSGAIQYDAPQSHVIPEGKERCDTCEGYLKQAREHLHYPDDADELTRGLIRAATPAPSTSAPRLSERDTDYLLRLATDIEDHAMRSIDQLDVTRLREIALGGQSFETFVDARRLSTGLRNGDPA